MDDETLIAGMPAIPKMVPPEPVRRYRPKPPPPVIPPLPNGIASRPPPPSPSPSPSPSTTAKPHLHPKDGPPDKPLSTSVCVSVKAVVRRTINNLNAARQAMHRITEFQRIEAEGGILPPRGLSPTPAEKEKQQEERCEREEFRRIENKAARERRNAGGEVGQEEAVKVMKKCSAGMLAHAGFEGANETALDLFTRVAVDHLDGLGKTFRLLLDGFSHKMTPEVSPMVVRRRSSYKHPSSKKKKKFFRRSFYMPYMKTVKLNRGIWKLILKMISNEKISRLQRCSAKCVKHSMKW